MNPLKFKITFLLLLLSPLILIAQDLYVDNSSYIYVRDIPIFVNDDIRLEAADSFIYLRGNGQLIQNTDSKNSDLGELSVYQEQTTELYEYNYWCSPVGVSIDGVAQANLNWNSTNMHLPADLTDLTNVNSSIFTFTPNLDATESVLSSYWIYSLESAEGYFGWNFVGENVGGISPGYGFTLKGRPDPPPLEPKIIDFRGRPNNGTIAVNVNWDGFDNEPFSEPINQAATLTGNPYPSAMDLKLFYVNSATNQANLDGNIYFWEQAAIGSHEIAAYEGGYAVYNPGPLGDLTDNGTYTVATFRNYNNDGGNEAGTGNFSPDFTPNFSRRYAAIGQGFLVVSGNAGGAEITNSMRLYLPQDSNPGGSGAVFRNNESTEETVTPILAMSHNGVNYDELINNPTKIPEIRIHTHIDNTYYRENVIAFRPGYSVTFNKFGDATMGNMLNDDVYMFVDNKKLNIKSVQLDESTRIPLGIMASGQNSSFSIKVFSQSEDAENLEVYIYDKDTEQYTDIVNNSFNIILDEGEINDRFEITFSTEDTLDNPEFSIDDFKVYQDNNAEELVILNPNLITVQSVSLTDSSGKWIFSFSQTELRDNYRYSTSNLSDGVYIATIDIEGRNSMSKKLIIQNR